MNMKGLENSIYLILYIISNIVGILLLLIALKNPKLARLMFFLLFGWACWTNYTTVRNSPGVYLEYAAMSLDFYADFINGWFKNNITTIVTLISLGQGLIALGMILKGWWVRIACFGAIVFLICIAPLGVGAAFPFSITASLAAITILRKDNLNYLWKFRESKN